MGDVCKVLIVDDEMLIRQGIINYIDWEQEGFQIVAEASNGKEALQLMEEFSPHIVITDIVMPIMDGIDLVREGKKAFPDIEFIVLSSFENFDYVRATFQNGVADYILKPKLNGEELLGSLNKIVNRMPSLCHTAALAEPTRSVEDMLEHFILGYDSAGDKASLAAAFANSRFALVGIHGKQLEAAKAKRQLEQLLPEGTSVFLAASSETDAKFLLNFSPYQFEEIKKAIAAEAANRSSASWLVCEPFGAIDDLKKVHDESLKKIEKYLFYLPDQTLFFYDELPAEGAKQANFDLNHFIELFKDHLFNAAFDYLENHIEYLAGRYSNDSFEFKSFLGNIIFNIIVLLDSLKYDIQELERNKYSYFSNINEAEYAKEAVAEFHGFMAEVRKIMLLHAGSEEQANNLDKILSYIEQHYTEPLRLSEIANHFHFNASYLSSYFSMHHKEGFSEYLNRIRIKKSMELLENSPVTISNISGMVGYSDHSYYCKVFKRITGMSPGAYRKEYHAHHENEAKGLAHLKK